VNELRDWLVANSGEAAATRTPVPGRFTNAYNQFEDLGARLLRCTDAALATQIASDSHESYCFLADQPKAVAAGQPCYLVVPAESEIKFRNALKKLGYGLP